MRYLTISSMRDFIMCGRKGYLANVQRIRKAKQRAVTAFGQSCHSAIELFYRAGRSSVEEFDKAWMEKNRLPIEYKEKETQADYMEQGRILMKLWEESEDRPKDPIALEVVQRSMICGIVPFLGVLDYIGGYNTGVEIVDWKTAAADYSATKAPLDLQLTSYAYLETVNSGNIPERVGFGVLVKAKRNPRVVYHYSTRNEDHFREFEGLAIKVWRDIHDDNVFATPGQHCDYCDYLPVCMGASLEKLIDEGHYKIVPPRYDYDETLARETAEAAA